MLEDYEVFWTETFTSKDGRESFEEWLTKNESISTLFDLISNLKVESVLDVACGIGLDYVMYKKAGLNIKYVGLDITEKFLVSLKREYSSSIFLNARAQHIPLKDGTFDIVTSRHLLGHVPDPYTVLSEMARVSKKYVLNVWFRLGEETNIRKVDIRNIYVNDYSREDMLCIIKGFGLVLLDEIIVPGEVNKNHIWLMEKAR